MEKSYEYLCFLSVTSAIPVMAIAVTIIPNPGDFFVVVPTGAGSVVVAVWGMVVTLAIGAVVRMAVVGEVLGTVVVAGVVGLVVTIVVGVCVT